jgi:hypothetical protein
MRGRRVGHVPGGTCRVVEGDAVLLLVGVLLLAFEYGVQCLPLALTNARDGPDRIDGHALNDSEFRSISERPSLAQRPSLAESRLVTVNSVF